VDHDGRIIDFHALRHTCGAWAATGGASPKAIQTLMRHSSIMLTLDTYGHLLPDEAEQTVGRMPSTNEGVLRLTGTADAGETPPAAGPATRAQTDAIWRDAAQKTNNRVSRLLATKTRFANEADGTRTRNHRIDSPVL